MGRLSRLYLFISFLSLGAVVVHVFFVLPANIDTNNIAQFSANGTFVALKPRGYCVTKRGDKHCFAYGQYRDLPITTASCPSNSFLRIKNLVETPRTLYFVAIGLFSLSVLVSFFFLGIAVGRPHQRVAANKFRRKILLPAFHIAPAIITTLAFTKVQRMESDLDSVFVHCKGRASAFNTTAPSGGFIGVSAAALAVAWLLVLLDFFSLLKDKASEESAAEYYGTEGLQEKWKGVNDRRKFVYSGRSRGDGGSYGYYGDGHHGSSSNNNGCFVDGSGGGYGGGGHCGGGYGGGGDGGGGGGGDGGGGGGGGGD